MNDVYALRFSNHDLIGFNHKQNRVKTAPKTICCRNYCRYDYNMLKDNLKNADWSPVYISHSSSDSLHYEFFFLIDMARLLQKGPKLIYFHD